MYVLVTRHSCHLQGLRGSMVLSSVFGFSARSAEKPNINISLTTMNNTRYYLGFNIVNGIGPARLDRLIERCGSIEAAWRAGLPDMIAVGLDAKICAALLQAQRTLDLDAELDRAARAGIQLLTREDAGYPTALAQIPAPPPLIYVKGRLEEVDDWSVAVVGTRSPSTYGRDATRRIVGDLAGAGVTVVSGLALSCLPTRRE